MEVRQQDFLKKENQSLVLQLVLKKGPISRAEIARELKMSATSASRIVHSLHALQYIKEAESNDFTLGEVGRKATYYVVNRQAVVTIGVEIEVDKVKIAILDLSGTFICMEDYNLPTRQAETVVRFIAKQIQNLLAAYDLKLDVLYGIGIGLPGVVNHEHGTVLLSDQLGWKNTALTKMVREYMTCHVTVDNELKLKALAEVLMDHDPFESVVTIGVGKGIGSALIVGGKIYRGKDNFAGEIGHMTVNPYGNYCSCGQQGCLNTYVSTVYVVEEAKKISDVETMDDIVSLAEQNVSWARNLVQKVSTYVVVAINNVTRAYNPDVIYLSGELVENYPLMRALIFEQYEEQTVQPKEIIPRLRMTTLHENDVVLGAGMGMMQGFIQQLDFMEDTYR